MKFFAVMLISYVVIAQECEAEPIECYECSTYAHDEYCADPFNATHPNAKTLLCDGACAKWVRKPKVGKMQYVRTCSENLTIKLRIGLVCMKESRPGDGHLCFCEKDNCNGARPTAGLPPTRTQTLMLAAFAAILAGRWGFAAR